MHADGEAEAGSARPNPPQDNADHNVSDELMDPFDRTAAGQRASERDRAAVAREQTAAGRDHTAADRDRLASYRDDVQAAVDQRVADRDAAAADRDRAAADRDQAASDRDESEAAAQLRTINWQLAAKDRDKSAADREQAKGNADQRITSREQAAADRARSAADRAQAADDRVSASHDREQASGQLRQAQLDGLTGAFGRELGMVLLEREIHRARRGKGRLVLAYVDVDGLKRVNDSQGHAAGDRLLQDVVEAIQQHLRSYDPIVRVGGDEFVCALADSTLMDARRRLEEMRVTIEKSQPAATVSVGLAALRSEDTLPELIARADEALYDVKKAKYTPSP